MDTPRLPSLDDHEALALMTAVRHLIYADGEVSMAELTDLVELGTALGEKRFARVMEQSESLHRDRQLALEMGATLRRAPVRRVLVGILEAVAAGDGLHPDERAFIDDLQRLWRERALPSGLERLTNRYGTVAVHPIGATVCSWVPAHGTEHLFVSPHATFAEGSAIRGGIPVCWPWFARDRPGPSHGLVRTRRWELAERTWDQLVFRTHDTPETRAHWPHPFQLELTVRLGATLNVVLVHHNTGTEPVEVWGALHTYLRDGLHVDGLDGAAYYEKTTSERGVQQGPIDAPVDRVLDANSARTRRTHVSTSGPNLVVWNPGAAAEGIDDLRSPRGFVCVEGAVAGVNRLLVAPDQSVSLSVELAPIANSFGVPSSPSR